MYVVRGPLAAPAVFLLAALGPSLASSAQLSYELSSSPDTVVIQLREEDGVRDGDDTPLVRVYGDGRVRVHFPAYMRRAGDYELRLTAGALQELLRAAAGSILPFDAASTQSQVRALQSVERDEGVVVAVADRSTTILEMRYERFRAAGAAADVLDGVKRVAWNGLASDAERFGSVGALQDLAGIRQRVRALADHPDLEPVTPR